MDTIAKPAFCFSRAAFPALALALCCVTPAFADDSGLGKFWLRHGEGWFFYNEPKEKPKKKPKPKKERKQVAVAPTPRPEQTQRYSGPPPLSSAWLKANLPKYLNRALDNPTPANVQAYLILQKISLDKASKFSAMAERVSVTSPMLDEATRRPFMTAGTKVADAIAYQYADKLLKRMARRMGLFAFYTGNCPYCSLLGMTLRAYQRLYGFTVLPVSLDGSGLPKGFPTKAGYRVDQGQSLQMGVTAAPAVIMVNMETRDYVSVIQGTALSMDELKDRILLAAVLKGWISEDEYRRAMPASDVPYIDTAGLFLKPNPDGFVDPAQIIKAFSRGGK